MAQPDRTSSTASVQQISPPAAASEVPVKGTWSIAARVLPPPVGASEKLRAILAGQPAPEASHTAVPVEVFKTIVAKRNAEQDYIHLVVPPLDTPETAEHYRELNAFVLRHLPVASAKAPRLAA